MAVKSYIRKPAVFNPGSAREKRIWDWIESSTNNFEAQNFASFVRDKLEWCMQNEGVYFTPNVVHQPIPQESKQGYSKLL
ncbi:hypothetical protein PAECIP111891_06700 [Paenibacillus allorhizoplanae]|uniref:Uncharacterized protein n=1 Tax=Paenibacillus allorhizoplanae TaxID=2905648 RepID=A0ABM9D0S7_9BACL|nr:hypothetical protein [Paenibacillus allorhizoplanae]CAH1230620.1 hypothetical protein PAECIP111891_06700 [Paenibacillus allorhizoplanae]